MANATWGWVLEAGGTGVNFRRFHHLNCAPGSLPPLWGKVRKGGSGRLQHCHTPPHPVLTPARGEGTLKRRAGEGLNLTPMPHRSAPTAAPALACYAWLQV